MEGRGLGAVTLPLLTITPLHRQNPWESRRHPGIPGEIPAKLGMAPTPPPAFRSMFPIPVPSYGMLELGLVPHTG